MFRSVIRVLSSTLLFQAVVRGSPDTLSCVGGQQTCSAYAVSTYGSSQAIFAHHEFIDYQSLQNDSNELRTSAMEIVDSTMGDELKARELTTSVIARNLDKRAQKTIPVRYSPSNVLVGGSVEANNTYLTLRTKRLARTQSAAELQFEHNNVLYASMRMRARVRGAKGAVAGFFTYYNDTAESDIEIRTSDSKGVYRYTNQPTETARGREIKGASLERAKLPSWSQWQTHRLDWLPGHTWWYLNNHLVANSTYSVPDIPSYLRINMWSNNGTWTGQMEVGDEAFIDIKWVEIFYNTSSSSSLKSRAESVGQALDDTTGLKAGKRDTAASSCNGMCLDDSSQSSPDTIVRDSAASGTGNIFSSSPFLRITVLLGTLAFLG